MTQQRKQYRLADGRYVRIVSPTVAVLLDAFGHLITDLTIENIDYEQACESSPQFISANDRL